MSNDYLVRVTTRDNTGKVETEFLQTFDECGWVATPKIEEARRFKRGDLGIVLADLAEPHEGEWSVVGMSAIELIEAQRFT